MEAQRMVSLVESSSSVLMSLSPSMTPASPFLTLPAPTTVSRRSPYLRHKGGLLLHHRPLQQLLVSQRSRTHSSTCRNLHLRLLARQPLVARVHCRKMLDRTRIPGRLRAKHIPPTIEKEGREIMVHQATSAKAIAHPHRQFMRTTLARICRAPLPPRPCHCSILCRPRLR